jgi:hypothetical protein
LEFDHLELRFLRAIGLSGPRDEPTDAAVDFGDTGNGRLFPGSRKI